MSTAAKILDTTAAASRSSAEGLPSTTTSTPLPQETPERKPAVYEQIDASGVFAPMLDLGG